MDSKAIALHLAVSIDIAGCRQAFNWKLVFGDRDELFYSDKGRFVYIFRYGIVSFYGFSEESIATITTDLKPYCEDWQQPELTEEIKLEMRPSHVQPKVTNNKIVLPSSDFEAIRLVLLHLSQSVALDYFAGLSEQIMKETRLHTSYLEHNGKLHLGGKKLKKYIAKVLNINNQISENLYIFDSHEVTWEDENLDRLDGNLKRIFDLKERYRSIKEQGYIIKENLSLFKDIMDHRESSRLEWIIIILILVEVMDIFIMRIIN
ncbi:MAG: RMD1 family protein [Allomuricauda sp.]